MNQEEELRKDDTTLYAIIDALRSSWSADTAYDSASWSSENPARGQCLVSSLVIQQYLGGDLVSFAVTGEGIDETHHCNVLPDGTLLDTTDSQYNSLDVTQTPKSTDTKGFSSLRERYLSNEYDRSRYEILKTRVDRQLSASS